LAITSGIVKPEISPLSAANINSFSLSKITSM
jgi:hypothetical protein